MLAPGNVASQLGVWCLVVFDCAMLALVVFVLVDPIMKGYEDARPRLFGVGTLALCGLLVAVGWLYTPMRDQVIRVVPAHYGVLTGIWVFVWSRCGMEYSISTGRPRGFFARWARSPRPSFTWWWVSVGLVSLAAFLVAVHYLAIEAIDGYLSSFEHQQRYLSLSPDERENWKYYYLSTTTWSGAVWKAVYAGVTEELIFRFGILSFLLWKLRNRRWGLPIAVIASAVLFSVAHFSPAESTVYILSHVHVFFIYGVGLACIFLAFGLEMAVIAHASIWIMIRSIWMDRMELFIRVMDVSQ